MKLVKLLIINLILVANVYAQDPHFSQFYANPLYLNPALTGIVKAPHFVINYRNQWPQINNAYITYNASYDQYAKKLHGGIGGEILYDKAAGGLLSTGLVSGTYAYHLKVNRKITVNAGFKATYVEKSMDWNNAVWGDQIDNTNGFIYQSQQPTGNVARYADFSSGLLIYSERIYLGFAADHITSPKESLFGSEQRLPIKYTLHAGADLSPRGNKNFTFSPNVLISKQSTFTQYNIGMYFKKEALVLGSWYRVKDAIVFLVGLKLKNMNLGYSFDFTVSNLYSTAYGGTHELSASFTLPSNKSIVKNRKALPCPSF